MSGTITIPNDPNPALRAEYMAALALLVPQISGLQDLATMPFSPDAHAQIAAQIAAQTARQTDIMAALSTLDAVVKAREVLADNGYPATPLISMPGSLFFELQEKKSDIATAIAMFTDVSNVGFDPAVKPTDIPQPVPSQKV